MRSKVTLVLIFLNVALAVIIFHFERSWRTESVAREVRRRVLGAEAADIRSLDVTTGTPGGGFSLERRADGWFLTRPVEWRANPSAVSRIINDLQFLDQETSFAVRDVVKNGQSLADYGLDHAKLTVSFASGGPDTTGSPAVRTILRLGDATKVGQRVYLLSSDGERIHVIRRELADSLSMPLEQLRADTVLTIPVFETKALNVQASPPAGVLVLIQRASNRWWFETPIPARADKDAVERAVNGLGFLRLREFAEAPPGPPDLRVTLVGNNRQETLYLGPQAPPASAKAPADGKVYYAQLEDQSKPSGRSACFTVAVPDYLLATLRQAQESLRDKRVLDFDPAAVTLVTLRGPNQPELRLQRLDQGAARSQPDWQIVLRGDALQGPSTLPADRAAVARLLDRLAFLSAEQFKSDAPQELDLEHWGFMSPERTVVLTLAQQQPPGARAPAGAPPAPAASQITLEIGRSTQREPYVYARLADALSVYTVDPDILRETPLAPAAWRDRQLPALPAAAKISGLKLTDLKTGAVAWEWAANRAAGGDGPAAAVLVEAVRSPRARQFASDTFAPVPGHPWRYRLDATIALPAGPGGESAGVRTLWLAERSGGGEQFAGSAEFGAVFALEQALVDALWKLTYGGRDPGPPPPPATGPATPAPAPGH